MKLLRNLLSLSYTLRMAISKFTGLGIDIQTNKNNIAAPENFYNLHALLNSGENISFEKYKGKKIIIVNLASQCGYTPQYKELEKLYRENNELVILGFPSNNFGAQEPGSDAEIAQFCAINFGVSFPVFRKDDVKGNSKQSVYAWMSDTNKNGWNDTEPQWNFYKYLIDEKGNLSKVYSSSVSPQEIKL